MRPSCSQIYCSPFLDLIFSALLEIQPKLSRNAVTYLNCARNPEQFWSIWGYLSHATCPVLTASSWESFCCPSCPTSSPTPKVPRDARAGCSQGCALLQPHLSHPIPVGMVRGARGAQQAQHTPPKSPHHRTPSAPAATKVAQHISNSQGCFSEWKYRSRETFPTVPWNKGCAGWQEELVIDLWEQKCSFHSGLLNAWRHCRSVHSGYRWTHHSSKLARQHGSSPQCTSTDLCISLKQPIWNDH